LEYIFIIKNNNNVLSIQNYSPGLIKGNTALSGKFMYSFTFLTSGAENISFGVTTQTSITSYAKDETKALTIESNPQFRYIVYGAGYIVLTGSI
jgi:hypothetical protein